MTGKDIVIVNGIVTADDHLPRVEISTIDGSATINMDAEDATGFALLILRQAEQAKADAALVRWSLNMAPAKPQIAAAMLDSFREFRNLLDVEAKNRQEDI